jgi:hypothetical protein
VGVCTRTGGLESWVAWKTQHWQQVVRTCGFAAALKPADGTMPRTRRECRPVLDWLYTSSHTSTMAYSGQHVKPIECSAALVGSTGRKADDDCTRGLVCHTTARPRSRYSRDKVSRKTVGTIIVCARHMTLHERSDRNCTKVGSHHPSH